jgi:hypothetical protein
MCICPLPKPLVFGGVATGIMNAPLAVMAAGTGSALGVKVAAWCRAHFPGPAVSPLRRNSTLLFLLLSNSAGTMTESRP